MITCCLDQLDNPQRMWGQGTQKPCGQRSGTVLPRRTGRDTQWQRSSIKKTMKAVLVLLSWLSMSCSRQNTLCDYPEPQRLPYITGNTKLQIFYCHKAKSTFSLFIEQSFFLEHIAHPFYHGFRKCSVSPKNTYQAGFVVLCLIFVVVIDLF